MSEARSERSCGALAAWFYGGWGARRTSFGSSIGCPDRTDRGVASRAGLRAWRGRSSVTEALDSRADGRAAEAFVEERVFATEARTGVLIFLALFEHRVIVMADEGISIEQSPSPHGDEIASSVREQASGTGSPSKAALIDAVKRCADILIGARCAGETRPTSSRTSRGFEMSRLAIVFALVVTLLIAARRRRFALEVPATAGPGQR